MWREIGRVRMGHFHIPIVEEKKQQTTYLMLILEAKKCLKNKDYIEAINKAQQALSLESQTFEADYLLAQIYANLGKYSQAIEHCKRASKADAMSVFPYYLKAQIAEEQGDLEQS
jgi:chemotaxis protein methyltransferase CheR